MKEDWKQDPRLSGMDPKKLKYLSDFSDRVKRLSKSQLMPALLSLQMDAARNGVSFSDQETALLIEILSDGMSPEGKKRMEVLRGVAQKLSRHSSQT